MANLSNINNKLLVGTNGEVRIGDTATVADVKLRIKQLDNQWPMQIVSNYAYGLSIDTSPGTDGSAGSLQIYPNSGGGFIVRNDSRVGIGTYSPSSYYAKQLVVKCSSNENGISIIANATSDSNYLMFGDGTSGPQRYEGYIEFNHSTNLMSYRSSGEMRFMANAVERMRVESDGIISIGEGETQSWINNKVQVTTTAVSGTNLTNIDRTAANLIRFTNPQYSTSAQVGLLLKVFPNSDARQGAGLLMTGGSDNSASNLSLFVSKDDGTGSNVSQSYSALHAVGNTGNVGIGTTAPNYLLDIQSTATGLTSNLKLNKDSTTGDYAEIAFQLWSGAGSGLNTFSGSGTSRPSVVLRAINENANSAAGAFVVGTFAGGATNSTLTEKFRITSAGNVGIGTTSPGAKLTVKGATQFGGDSTSVAPVTTEHSAYGTTQNLYTITLSEGAVWSPGIAVINFAASRSGLQKHYGGQIIVRLTYYNGSGVAGQGGWGAPSSIAAVVAYSGQAEGNMRVYVNGTGTGNPMTIQIGVRDIDDTTNYFVSDIRVTLRSGVSSITN